MISSTLPKGYSFDKQGTIKEIDLLTCKTIISPQKLVDTTDNLTSTTHVLPNFYEASNILKMNIVQEDNFNNEIYTNAYENKASYFNNINTEPYADNIYVYKDPNAYDNTQPIVYAEGNQYNANLSQGIDPGVVAVSNALFALNSSFHSIPIIPSPNVFRRRKRGEGNSEWSNAFVTRVDPCECLDPVEEYTPYEATKYYDNSGVRTVLNFDN